MKSYCKGLVMDREHIAKAYGLWLRATAGHKNAWRVTKEYGGAEALIDELEREIYERSLDLKPIHRYRHREPTNGKIRIIGVESVKQQVLDYAVVLAMKPLLGAKLGFYQVAGVPGKGQLACKRAMRKWVHEGGYHAKLDIKQCYPSGLEIGSYFSLQMANLVLSFAYHHIEGLRKERRGMSVPLVTHQLWHLDDALLISPDKRNLKMAVRSLVRYMREELGLTVKPWKIARTSDAEPLDMGGFVVRKHSCTLRSQIFLRATRAFRRFAKRRTLRLALRVCSYWGWLVHSDSDDVILGNGFNRLFRKARAIISRAGKAEPWSIPKALPS